MTDRKISLGRSTARALPWSPIGYAGETHYRTVLAAVLSASAILCAAAIIMSRLLSA